jgi:hypothetical protein
VDFVPSVQETIAFSFAALCAAVVAFASTPPWPEQAPRPLAEDVDPSVHTDADTACALARVETLQRATRVAVNRKKRTRIGGSGNG